MIVFHPCPSCLSSCNTLAKRRRWRSASLNRAARRKCFDQFSGEGMADHKAGHADDIRRVIRDPSSCRKNFMNLIVIVTPLTTTLAFSDQPGFCPEVRPLAVKLSGRIPPAVFYLSIALRANAKAKIDLRALASLCRCMETIRLRSPLPEHRLAAPCERAGKRTSGPPPLLYIFSFLFIQDLHFIVFFLQGSVS